MLTSLFVRLKDFAPTNIYYLDDYWLAFQPRESLFIDSLKLCFGG